MSKHLLDDFSRRNHTNPLEMRILLSTFGIFSFFLIKAQEPSDSAVIAAVIDSLVKLHHFSFYTEKLQYTETEEYASHPFDTFTIFDSETYEDVVRRGVDFKIYFDSINLEESKLFKQRDYFPDGLYLIDNMKSNVIDKNIVFSEYINLPGDPNIQEIKPLSDSILKSDKLGLYTVRRATKENYALYKYVMKAQFIFSGIVWDKTGMFCLVECGYHYNIPVNRPDTGPTGGGFQVVLENKNGIPRIIKSIGLWEE